MDIGDFFRFLFKMTLSRNQMTRDIQSMRTDISDLKSMLVPFTKEEMELLSLNQSNQSKKKGFQPLTKGIFNTIYYEPLIAYAIKSYPGDNKLILITSTTDEFIYLIKPEYTQVYMNNIEAGIITPKGEFFSINKTLLATVDGADHLPTHAVFIKNKNVGFIANPKYSEKTIPRAFTLLKDMNIDEQNIFLCLTLINLIEEAQ